MITRSRRMRWVRHLWMRGEVSCRIFVGKPEGKRRLGIPGRRWEYNIKEKLS
jgi:hypothetical protein